MMGHGWYWAFDDGVLKSHRVPTRQLTGLPPEGLIVFPMPATGGVCNSGWMPVPDTPENRELLLGARERFAPHEVHVYVRASYSELTDEQAEKAAHVARGALYAARGTLQEEEA